MALLLVMAASIELRDIDPHARAAAPTPGVSASAAAPEPPCGSYRVAIKTLRDPGAGSVHQRASASTVAALGRLPAPSNGLETRAAVETRVWRLQGVRAVAMKLQRDGDVHLVVADPQGRTMITEFPAGPCIAAAAPANRASMDAARRALIRAFGQPPSNHFAKLARTVSLEGVGFFDRLHNQLGAAPNGVELHPVVGFQTGTRAQA